MPLDSQRCHFCGNWTKNYRKVGDKSFCRDCVDDLIELIRDELKE